MADPKTTTPEPKTTTPEPKTTTPEPEITEGEPVSIDDLVRAHAELAELRKSLHDDLDARLAKLPAAVRGRLPKSAGHVAKAAFLAGVESALPRAPATANLGPPAGLGPTAAVIREEDLERMPQAEFEKLEASGELAKAMREGRLLPRSSGGGTR